MQGFEAASAAREDRFNRNPDVPSLAGEIRSGSDSSEESAQRDQCLEITIPALLDGDSVRTAVARGESVPVLAFVRARNGQGDAQRSSSVMPNGDGASKIVEFPVGSAFSVETSAATRGNRIAFSCEGVIRFLSSSEILAIEAAGNYVQLVCKDKSPLIRGSISSVAEQVRPLNFVRIHRSVVVNVEHVDHLESLATGEFTLTMSSGKTYTVSRFYKNAISELATVTIGTESLLRRLR